MKLKSAKIIIILLVFMWVSIMPTAVVLAVSDETVKLTIIHINDTHGRTRAEPYIAALVNDLRQKNENVLLLDAGDRLHGQTTTNLSKGESMVAIMNAVGYDAMVPGNHDFSFGTDRLAELAELMNFPLLAANVRKDGQDLFEPYRIYEMSGLKVGVFGIATPETVAKSDPRIMTGLSFGDPAQTAAVIVGELQTQGCDIIIALAHLGESTLSAFEDTSDALAAIPGIDVIIDGHSHTLLEHGRISEGTLIAQTGEYGEHIGIVELTLSNTGLTKTARTIPVPDENGETYLTADEDIIAAIIGEDAKIEHITNVLIGSTPEELHGEREQVRTGDTNLANLITDSMRHSTGADIAILTGGNIRASISEGNITMGDVLTVLPYSNLLVTVELSGADLLDALEHGVSMYPEPAGQFIQVSGINIEFNPDSEPGSRVKKATLTDGSAIDLNKTYTVVTIEFLAAGGDGYEMLKNGTNLIYYGDDAETFAEYLATNPAINAEPESRIKAVYTNDNNETGNTPGRIIIYITAGAALICIVLLAVKKRK